MRVIIGDVQGKGLEAVETAASVLGAFREAAYNEPDLSAVGDRVECAVRRTVDMQGDGEKFVTALLAEITEDRGTVFVNYGHTPALVVRRDRETFFAHPPEHALPLGLTDDGERPTPYQVDFGPGDQLLLYTDGVTEARGPSGAFYPLRERTALLEDRDPQEALDALRADVVSHAAWSPSRRRRHAAPALPVVGRSSAWCGRAVQRDMTDHPRPAAASSDEPDFDDVTRAVLTASRLLVAVSARSLAAMEDNVTVPQFRMLVVLATRGATKLVVLADQLGVSPSTAMRMVDRLITAGLADRRRQPREPQGDDTDRHGQRAAARRGRDRPPPGRDRGDRRADGARPALGSGHRPDRVQRSRG